MSCVCERNSFKLSKFDEVTCRVISHVSDEYNGRIVMPYSDTKENKINKKLDMKAGWRSRLGVPSICAALWE